jgi:hypothetical protein
MSMPPQLAKSKRRRLRHSEPRPTIELMPAININELRHAIPRDYGTNIYANPFRYPQVRHIRLSCRSIEITDHSGRVQSFRIVWIPTYFGRDRALLACGSCWRRTTRLFARCGTYACRYCHKAVYASQKHDQIGRKRLAAAKLRLIQLNSLPDIHEPVAPKSKWKRHQTKIF